MSKTGNYVALTLGVIIVALLITIHFTGSQYVHPRNANEDCLTPQDYPVCARIDEPAALAPAPQAQVIASQALAAAFVLLLIWGAWRSSVTTNSLMGKKETPSKKTGERPAQKTEENSAPKKAPKKKLEAPSSPEDIVSDEEVNN